MAVYARVENGVVIELIETGDYSISQLFAPAFVESMVRVPEGMQVEIGAPLNDFGKDLDPHGGVQIPVLVQTPVAADQPDAEAERSWRLCSLSSTEWLVARHRDEQDLGRGTSVDATQFLQLLEYRQALRDWPDAKDFPARGARPATPAWLSISTGEQ